MTQNNVKSEKQIQNEIRLALSENGCVCFRANVGLFFTKTGVPVSTGLPKGFPDLFGVRLKDKQIFFVEVKNAKGCLSEKQKTFGEWAKRNDIMWGVARSPEEAIEIVKR